PQMQAFTHRLFGRRGCDTLFVTTSLFFIFFKITRNYKEKSSVLMCYFYKSYVTKLLVKKRFL
ncbi:hypothetical protein CUS28_10960, partial [Enterococcus faecium]|uniref:hypothetical protein n=1 Tax=Enterococcus faecium TaxID=1352 RepID=UPI000CF30544